MPTEPIEPIIDEIPEQPIVKPTKKKQQQRQQPLSASVTSANMTNLPVEAPPSVAVPVEE